MLANEIRDTKAECQIIVFSWHHPVPLESLSYTALSISNPIDVSLELEGSIAFEKNLGDAAGSFTFSLSNTRDWKRTIRPGTWCLIYMSQGGGLSLPHSSNGLDLAIPNPEKLKLQKNKLRGICYIERIATESHVNENGTLELNYQVSGRDFGVIYEETEVWHNFFKHESGIIDAAANYLHAAPTPTVDQLLATIHHLFFTPFIFPSLSNRDPKDREQETVASIGFQWNLPREMLTALNLELFDKSRAPFWGNIKDILNFQPTKATLPIENPMATLNGNAWEKLKSNSIEPFHELFTELDENGNPKLNFRPIPWALDKSGYPTLAPYIMLYRDLAKTAVVLNNVEIMDFNLGECDHERYNHFYCAVNATDSSPFDNISQLQYPSKLGKIFPWRDISSIARHGFRPMHVEMNSLLQVSLDGKPDQRILVEFNELLLDMWTNAIFFESGSVGILGRNDVRVGKALLFSDEAVYNTGKMFYIEGYTDEFLIEENGVGSWTQQLKVTRGAEVQAIKRISNFFEDSGLSKRLNEFRSAGEFTNK